jgi:hypothetical protein
MRNLLMALVVVGLLVAPSFAAPTLNVQILANGQASASVLPGTAVAMTLQVKGDGTSPALGVADVAGSIVANVAGGMVSSGFAFAPAWTGTFADTQNYLGTPGANGGWDNFGVTQNTALADSNTPTYGQGVFVNLASWTVVAGSKTTTFSFVPDDNFDFGPLYNALVGVDASTGMVFNLIPASIVVVPEPVTMALLALGGLVIARRRSH